MGGQCLAWSKEFQPTVHRCSTRACATTWVASTITVRHVSISIASASRTGCHKPCRSMSVTDTSDENGDTKKHRPSERDRTRQHRGGNKVCSGGTLSCGRTLIGFTFCTNLRRRNLRYLNTVALLWAFSRTIAFCRNDTVHQTCVAERC